MYVVSTIEFTGEIKYAEYPQNAMWIFSGMRNRYNAAMAEFYNAMPRK
jgi:hypothetical protein